jgi:DNA-binding response OmpR family regulator
MTNPVGFKQVFARFQRWVQPRSEPGAPSAEVIQAGDFRIDLQCRRVTVRGNEVRLTQEEFSLLVFLTTHPKKVVTPSTRLVTRAGGNRVRQTQFLRVLLGLCRKIEPDNSHHYLRTEPWVFYRFDPGAQL